MVCCKIWGCNGSMFTVYFTFKSKWIGASALPFHFNIIIRLECITNRKIDVILRIPWLYAFHTLSINGIMLLSLVHTISYMQTVVYPACKHLCIAWSKKKTHVIRIIFSMHLYLDTAYLQRRLFMDQDCSLYHLLFFYMHWVEIWITFTSITNIL